MRGSILDCGRSGDVKTVKPIADSGIGQVLAKVAGGSGGD
jgi:hypothetical protein